MSKVVRMVLVSEIRSKNRSCRIEYRQDGNNGEYDLDYGNNGEYDVDYGNNGEYDDLEHSDDDDLFATFTSITQANDDMRLIIDVVWKKVTGQSQSQSQSQSHVTGRMLVQGKATRPVVSTKDVSYAHQWPEAIVVVVQGDDDWFVISNSDESE
jgi:hypothetical protein